MTTEPKVNTNPVCVDVPVIPRHAAYEKIKPEELARRWQVPKTWVYERTRDRCDDPIPHVKLGKYVRIEWGSPELDRWWLRQPSSGRFFDRESGDKPCRKEAAA